MKILFTYLAALLSLSVLDAFWILFAAKGFYAKHLGFLFMKDANILPIIAFYPIYSLAIALLAVVPALEAQSLTGALWRGALLGLAAYSAYDLTNHATIANWPLIVTIADIAWGVFVTALASGIAYWCIALFYKM